MISTSGKLKPRRAKAKPQKTDDVLRAVWGGVLVVDVATLDPHPLNRPRTADEVSGLAESLRISGQLDPIKIWRPNTQSRWTVLGGWGRVLAARAGDLGEIEGRPLLGILRCGEGGVSPPTPAELLGVLAEDNSQRHDLTVFQRAELGRALREAGYTWDEAARRVGFQTRGSLANAERLLSLPESLRDRVGKPAAEGGITQDAARKIASVVHVPALVKAIEEDLEQEAEQWREYPEDSLNYVIRENLRPVDEEAARFACKRLPDNLPADLPTIEIALPDESGEATTMRFTADKSAWDKAATTVLLGRGEQADEDDEPISKPAPLSKEEQRRRAAEKAEHLAKRRARWEYRWRHRFVLRQLRGHGAGYIQATARITAWAICENQRNATEHLTKAIEQVEGCTKIRSNYPTVCERLACMSSGDSDWTVMVAALAVACFEDWQSGNPDFPHVPRTLVDQCCADLGFGAVGEWDWLYDEPDGVELLRELWESHDIESLRPLLGSQAPTKKSELVEALIAERVGLPLWLRLESGKKGKR